jgi:heme exporter protein D
VLLWAGVLVLGAFGIVFSFANYPWFGTAVTLLILLAIGYAQRKRRIAQKTRRRQRARSRDLFSG